MQSVVQIRERMFASRFMPVFHEGPFITAELRLLQSQVTTSPELEILAIDGMS
jgi:hypothetical protein